MGQNKEANANTKQTTRVQKAGHVIRRSSVPVYFSKHFVAAAESFDTTRKAGWVAGSLRRNPIPGVELRRPRLLRPQQIEAVHDESYVRAVRTGSPEWLASSSGFAWDPGLWVSALASASGIVAAGLYAFWRRVHTGSLSSGLHHARRGSGGGFCTFNGLALAARAAIDAGAHRVLILDLDAHCGGGTNSLVRGWPEVWGLDISTSRGDDYDTDSVDRFTLDIVKDAGAYLGTIERRLGGLTGRIDLCLYNSGMDPHEDSWGLPGITTAVLAERERLVFEWANRRALPVAFCLAGGYTGTRMSQEQLVALHRLTIEAAARGAVGVDWADEGLPDGRVYGRERGSGGTCGEPRNPDAGRVRSGVLGGAVNPGGRDTPTVRQLRLCLGEPGAESAQTGAGAGLGSEARNPGRGESMSSEGKDTKRTGGELFYLDKNGKKQDAELHAEILGDDECLWDIDLGAFAKMTPDEQDAYLKRRDAMMRGE